MSSQTSRCGYIPLLLVLLWVASIAFAVPVDLPEGTILIEADAGQMENGVEVVEVDGASEGKATDHQRGIKTVHEIQIPEAGTWYLWVRLYCPNEDQDSYWVGIDDAEPDPAEDALGDQGVRIYSAAGDSANTDAQPFELWFWDAAKGNADIRSSFDIKSPGTYMLWTKGRETGTLLDQILLTLDEDFDAEVASQGEAIDPPFLSVQPSGKLAFVWGLLRN